jgi:hypothetical protein
MSKCWFIICVSLAAVIMFGCAQTEVNTNSNGSSPAPSTEATAGSDADRIGVAECDAFIDAYETCRSTKMPLTARVNAELNIDLWRKQWREILTQDPQAQEKLTSICKLQREKAKEATKEYGCTF